MFRKGTYVEVSSEEEGFKDSWYVATILKQPWKSASKKLKALVEFQTLHDGDGDIDGESKNSQKLLKEYVDVSSIRPLPPKLAESYKPNDIVDAFYRDGWWTGTVTKVLDDCRYVIFFKDPPEEMEFHSSDLRVHFQWVDDQWVRPEKLMAGINFSAGTPVEVNLGKESPDDIWFPAIFLEEVGMGTFLVKYQCSRQGAEAEFLSASVDLNQIRPAPPKLEDRTFQVLEKVHVFCDFGWRVGLITKVLIGERYVVFFKQAKEEREFSHSNIRPHMEWVDGKWINNSKEMTQQKEGELSSQRKKRGRPAKILVKCPKASAAGKEHNRAGKGADAISVKDCAQWPIITKSVSSVFRGSESKIPIEVGIESFRDQKKLLNITWHKEARSYIQTRPCEKYLLVQETSKQKVGGMSGQKKRRGRPTKILAKRPKTSVAGVEHNRAERGADAISVKDCTKWPIITGIESPVIKEPQPKIPGQARIGKDYLNYMRDQKKPLNVAWHKEFESYSIARPLLDMVKLPNEIVIQVSGNKLGKHSLETGRKYCITVCNGIPTEDSDGEKVDDISEADCLKNEVKMVDAGRLSGMANEDHPPMCYEGLHSAMIVYDSSISPSRTVQQLNEGRESQIDAGSQNSDGEKVDDISEADYLKNEVEMVDAGRLSDMAKEDQPLVCYEGLHSAMIVYDSRIFPNRTVQQLNEARESQIDAEMNQSLPFVKSSPVWEALESMAVFQKMPQKPHFNPLIESGVEFREGLAIGYMVSFASLVERANSLQMKDPVNSFNSSLEALLDLEMLGFDVKAVQGHLKELLSIKDTAGKLQDESKAVESEIMKHINAKTNLEEEVDEIDRLIRELQEKRALNMSKKEAEDSKICLLQSNANFIAEGILRAHLDFERLAAATF